MYESYFNIISYKDIEIYEFTLPSMYPFQIPSRNEHFRSLKETTDFIDNLSFNNKLNELISSDE